jgi:hypothetical protein
MSAPLSERLRRHWLPLALACAGGMMMMLGWLLGEAQTVMRKAIQVCLECIGIG